MVIIGVPSLTKVWEGIRINRTKLPTAYIARDGGAAIGREARIRGFNVMLEFP
jgi:hypothetical protein